MCGYKGQGAARRDRWTELSFSEAVRVGLDSISEELCRSQTSMSTTGGMAKYGRLSAGDRFFSFFHYAPCHFKIAENSFYWIRLRALFEPHHLVIGQLVDCRNAFSSRSGCANDDLTTEANKELETLFDPANVVTGTLDADSHAVNAQDDFQFCPGPVFVFDCCI